MPERIYRDFVIHTSYIKGVETDAKGRPLKFCVRVFDSPVGEGEHDEEMEVKDWDRLEKLRGLLARDEIKQSSFEELARDLGEMILPAYARGLYQSSLAMMEGDLRLRVRLRLVKELAWLPWEYALIGLHEGEATAPDYWSLDHRVSIVRHEAINVPAGSFRTGASRRVIVAMASPEPRAKYPPLELEKEQRAIKEKLQGVRGVVADYLPDFDAEPHKAGATEGALEEALHKTADIFHFSGHGVFKAEAGEDGIAQGLGTIILADDNNYADEVPAASLSGLLAEGQVRLVVLDACETGERDRFLQWNSVALALLKVGIPAVVAMQFRVQDVLGKLFASRLYEYMVKGAQIDEAVTQARRAMSRADPKRRDWGAPVLYLRNSGGNIFAPVTDPEARLHAEEVSERDTTLSEVLLRWTRRDAPASPEQLEILKQGGEAMELAPLDAVLLLRSAAACDHDTDHWVRQLHRVGAEWLAAVDKEGLEGPESPLLRADPLQGASRLAARALGVDNKPAGERPNGVGRLAASASLSEGNLTAQTAALSLLALKPDQAVGEIQDALKMIERGASRRRRRAMLLGALAEAGSDAEAKVRSELEHPQDRAAVWWWRARRYIRRDGALIMRWSLGGAFGAALALAVYRAFLAIFNARFMGTEFAIQSYWGFIIGFLMSLGMALAGPLLLHDMQTGDAGQRRGTNRLALLLGAAGFSLANGLVMWMNGLGLTFNTLMLFLFTSFLAGMILGIGLYGQPQAGWTAGLGTWLRRLLLPAILMAALQAPVLFETITGADGNYVLDNAQWLAASVFEPAEALVNKYEFRLAALFSQCIPVETGQSCLACTGSGLLYACFEQWWSMVDAAVTSIVLLLGMMTGWHFPQTWLGKLWNRLTRWLAKLV